ncbi:hypothetical protein PZA22_23405 [Pectobacterium polaris]|uniref:hypothetical protein n=1 Tax=Pectobacterium polaris TaxID=2042057 RepID=UPI0023AE9E6C|nr:hypothetical protein [Pectobacterium polaris]MDE8757415.1 hypothetical protein [Pectobacterium polaris]
MMALWLSGCNGEETLSEGKYLVEDVRVVFDNSKHPEANKNRDELQENITQSFKGIKDDIYFNLTPTQVIYTTSDGEYTREIKDNRVQINGMWHTLKIDGKNTVHFVSDKKSACAFYYCEITMVLKKTKAQSPDLLKIQQRFEERKKAYQAQLLEEKEAFNRAPMDDFPGIPFYLDEYFEIKLPFNMYDKLSLWNSGVYIRRMERLFIDRENKDTQIYSYQDKQNKTDLDLFTVHAAKEDFNLASWLERQKGVLFQSENGAVYDNQQGILEAIYFQYDEAKQRYFIGLANAEDAASLAKAFAVLRTMDERYRGEQELSMRDLALSQHALEEKYGINIANEFDIADMHQLLWKAIDRSLDKPERFIKSRMRITEVQFPSGHRFGYNVSIYASTKSLSELMIDAKEKKPEGKQIDDSVFTYGEAASEGYEYYINAKDGITLQFKVSRDMGTPLERLMFLHVLRSLDLTRFPAIPVQEINNLFKYESAPIFNDYISERYFVVNEGLLDSTGVLIIPTPNDGYYKFKESPPNILAVKYKEAVNTYYGTPGVTVFDEKGKLIAHQDD